MTTYYMRADGSAANKGAASGPGSSASACMSIATHNGETFSAGDVLALADDGGDFRDQLTPPSDGSSGSPITYQPESGDSPIINASELVTGWTVDSGNRWQASFTPSGPEQTDVFKVFFDGTLGTDAGSQAAVDATNEWHYDDAGNTLYVYSTSDPDTAFTSPGIEATSQDFCIYVSSKDYITIDGIDCEKAELDIIKSDGTTSGLIVQNLTLKNGAQNGFLETGSVGDAQFFNVISHDNGIDNQDHGWYMGGTTGTNNYLMENCTAYNNAGHGFQLYNGNGGTLRRCLAYDNGTSGTGAGILIQQLRDDANITLEYCVSYGNATDGFVVNSLGAGGYNGNNIVQILNCTAYGNSDPGLSINGNAAEATVISKNNMFFGTIDKALFVNSNDSATLTFDYNCYYRTTSNLVGYKGTNYTLAQFATYQSEKNQDANGIAADPLFMDAASNDYRLKSNSPCIEAGTSVTLSEDLDFDKRPLGRGTNPDIGAFETLKGGPRGL